MQPNTLEFEVPIVVPADAAEALKHRNPDTARFGLRTAAAVSDQVRLDARGRQRQTMGNAGIVDG